MSYTSEAAFEADVIKTLVEEKGWKDGVLQYKDEKDLIRNWADIIFDNNRELDRLGDFPVTDGEMQQIMEQINALKTPLKLNGFINGGYVQIIRDNEDDTHNFGKTISLKIFGRNEITAGKTRYQIAEQPIFHAKNDIYPNRRGDFCLLINGMPLFHVELKKSGVPVSEAQYQIQKYLHEGVFTGIFSLVQIFVAMNPEECVYFANPGSADKFRKVFCFHWADQNNDVINDWTRITERLLSIPMAHELIGFYTVADQTDNTLKVMRSYQYYAASKISKRVSEMKWDDQNIYGGYVWHTTGSGKTMTSFKSAQLIANSKDADKVVFLMDRIELGIQSLREYRGFSDETDDVQATENTDVLVTKLKSDDSKNTLIVTSIQKMSRIKEDEGVNASDIEKINKKRIVFIVDECHRSVFGEMLSTIKHTFPGAIFIGFSGTPILEINKKKDTTTADVFGDELSGTRYTVADGMRDRNVLGFDTVPQPTYKDKDLRTAIVLEKAKANSVAEIFGNSKKEAIYHHWMDEVPMGEALDDDGDSLESIEGELPDAQYDRDEHRKAVVDDIIEKGAILDAVDEGLITRDPTRKAIIKGKTPKAKKIKYLNQFELHTLIADLDIKDETNWDWFILLVAKTGMRFSEALAITPADFDFARQTLSISKTWDYKGDGGFMPTKNKSSIRKIQIDWQIVVKFSELVKGLPEDKPIFVGEYKIYNSTVNDILARHCKACGISSISIHGLRHTHASLLLFAGVSIASVARRLGHASMTTTQKTYLHIIQELENKDVDLVMRTLSGL